MSSRSRDRYRFEQALTTAARVCVSVGWSGSRKRDLWSNWQCVWQDGPTVPTMRALAARLRPTSFADAHLNFSRSSSEIAEAAAFLAALEADESMLRGALRPWMMRDAHEQTERPEAIIGPQRRRAVALVSLNGNWDELQVYASRGLAALCCWLDEVYDRETTNVIPLRRARSTGR